MADYTELKRLAEAATPGRNFDRLPMAGGGLKYECTGDDGSLVLKVDHKNNEWGFVGDNSAADEEFFLACTPAEVLALIAESARLQSAAKTLERLGYRDNCGELWKPPLGQKPDFSLMDQLKAENEALREEVALDDKLIADRDRLLNMFECPDHGQCIPYAMDQVEALRKDAKHLQSAIDFVQKLRDAAGNQPSVATGYLDDILSAMGKDDRP